MKPGPVARGVMIPLLERPRVETLAAQTHAAFEVVRRARAILALAKGTAPCEVAKGLGWAVRTVHKWRARWEAAPAVDTLQDGDRPGRPAEISMATRCDVVQLACDKPSAELFREKWTQQSLAEQIERWTDVEISRSSVQRILNAEGLRPHRTRVWLHSPDPDFREKTKRICDLYVQPAPKDTVILCVDEKPMQAISRRFGDRRIRDASTREDYEYRRNGTCCLLGAVNVKTGRVHGRVVLRRTAEALIHFMSHLARVYEGKHVIIVWDNLNTHYDGKDRRWENFNKKHNGRFEFVYTPIHASWVNQIEQWFSVLQRRLLRHGSFEHVGHLKDRVEGFIRWWNLNERKPTRWTFDGNFSHYRQRAA